MFFYDVSDSTAKTGILRKNGQKNHTGNPCGFLKKIFYCGYYFSSGGRLLSAGRAGIPDSPSREFTAGTADFVKSPNSKKKIILPIQLKNITHKSFSAGPSGSNL